MRIKVPPLTFAQIADNKTYVAYDEKTGKVIHYMKPYDKAGGTDSAPIYACNSLTTPVLSP